MATPLTPTTQSSLLVTNVHGSNTLQYTMTMSGSMPEFNQFIWW